MHASQLIVTRMPLSNLWDEQGQLEAHRVKRVGKEEISALLRDGSTFVVADVGQPLCWIPEQDRFNFWKAEVRHHLVPPEVDRFCLEAYPNEDCYVASAWHCAGSKPIVVLEKYH
jgi:hypothetical protein